MLFYIDPDPVGAGANHGDCKVTTGGLIWLAMFCANPASRDATWSGPIAVVTHPCTISNVKSSNGINADPVLAGTDCVPMLVAV